MALPRHRARAAGLAWRGLAAALAALCLAAGCAAVPRGMPEPPRERTVVLDALAGGTVTASLVAYSFSTGCEAGLGALSRTVDVRRAALCEGFTGELGPSVRVLPHEPGRFEAGHEGPPAEEAGAAWRLVIRLIPEQYPGGRRDQGLGRGLRQRYTGELSVAARLYRVSDGERVREVRYNRRVMGFTYEPERFHEAGRALGARVARDFGLVAP